MGIAEREAVRSELQAPEEDLPAHIELDPSAVRRITNYSDKGLVFVLHRGEDVLILDRRPASIVAFKTAFDSQDQDILWEIVNRDARFRLFHLGQVNSFLIDLSPVKDTPVSSAREEYATFSTGEYRGDQRIWSHKRAGVYLSRES